MDAFVGGLVVEDKVIERVAALWDAVGDGVIEIHHGEFARQPDLFIPGKTVQRDDITLDLSETFRVLRIETQSFCFLCYFKCEDSGVRALHVRMLPKESTPNAEHFHFGDDRDHGFVVSVHYITDDERVEAKDGMFGFKHFCWFHTSLQACEFNRDNP